MHNAVIMAMQKKGNPNFSIAMFTVAILKERNKEIKINSDGCCSEPCTYKAPDCQIF
jgi:hypothetical protein